MKRSYKVFLLASLIKKVLCILLVALILQTRADAQIQTQTPVYTTVDASRIKGYYESLPVTYQSQPTKKFPLLIFIHGKGEVGDGSAAALPKVLANGPPKLISQGKFPSSFTVGGESFSFIVISPQIVTNDYNGSPAFINKLVAYCKSKYRVDEERIYITGLSMGGGMVWRYIGVYAPDIAASVTVCGSSTVRSADSKVIAGANLPLWCTHNASDPTVSSGITKDWVNYLLARKPVMNPLPKMTIFDASGHDAWSKTYDPAFKEDGKNVYEWMLSYKRINTATPQPPVANAGAAQTITLPVNSVTIDGGKSTAATGSTLKSYAWTKLSGPTQATITNAAAASTTITGLVEGAYTFQLTVTDANGTTANSTVAITVKAAPLPPIANAGAAQSITLPVNAVTLDGSKSSAPSGTIKTYQWTKLSGPTSGTINSATAASTTISGLVEGVYTFQLKITDSNNATATATVTVTVYAAPVPPVANAGSDQVVELPVTSVTLDGSKSTAAAGSITTYQWTKIAGPTQGTLGNANKAIATITNLAEGIYEFELKVTDNKGSTATAKISVTVNAAKVPPTANAGNNQTITLPTSEVTLSGALSVAAQGRTISQYLWSKKTGPASGSIVNSSAISTAVRLLVEGIYEFELKVTDDKGLSTTATVTVTVKPQPLPPTANAGINQTITLPVNNVALDGSKSTATSGGITSFLWTKKSGPDGATIQNGGQAKTSVSGLTEGVYEFELKVTDNSGSSALSVVIITVKAAPLPPVAIAGTDIKLLLPVSSATLDGTASYANSGTITNYLWKQLSGPSTADIATPAKAVTAIAGLVEGKYVFELTVTDSRGDTGTTSVSVQVIKLPVADAGKDLSITLPVNQLVLDGTGSTVPSGSVISYSWTKLSGPSGGNIATASALITNITGLTVGDYEFQLLLTDQLGNQSASKVKVKVLPELKPPVADAGNSLTIRLPINTISLDGSLSTPAADIISYEWKKVSGPVAGDIQINNAAKTNVNNLEAGMYEFELTVKNTNGITAVASVTVTVQPPLVAPIVDAGLDQTISLPVNAIILKGQASGNIATYSWQQLLGPKTAVIESKNAATTNVNDLEEGVYQFQLTATDSNGLIGSDIATITVTAAPLPPLADAGMEQIITLPVNEAFLNGTNSSAPAGSIEKYEWSKVAGPAASIADTAAAATQVKNLVEGVYKFQLRITDNLGNSSTATVTITVNAALKPPVANAGNAQTITLPVNSVVLNGSKSVAPSGAIVKYQWQKSSGPAAGEITGDTSTEATAINLVEGLYQFDLTVTDDNGLASTASVTVTVKAAPLPPVANAGIAQTIRLPMNSITLDGSSSSVVTGSIASYAWKKVSGPGGEQIVSPANAKTQVNQLMEGIYVFELKITDDKGMSATADVTITVQPALLPPVANAGQDVIVILPQHTATLNGTKSSAPSGTITSYKWTQYSGPATAAITTATKAIADVSNLVAGIYEFELEVVDDHDKKSVAKVKVTVLPELIQPLADAGANKTVTLPVDIVELNASHSSAPGSSIESFSWAQVDGPAVAALSSVNESVIQAGNLKEGVYSFVLKVMSKNGLSATDTVLITVKPALLLPVAVAGSDQEITLPVNTVILNGAASYDSDGTIVLYEWAKVSGPEIGELQNSDKTMAQAIILAQGKYVFELKITDNDGLVATDRVVVTVNAAPALPIANAGSGQSITLPVNEVSLDGSKSEAPEGSITNYSWKQLSGPAVSDIKAADEAKTRVTGLVAGTYVFELEITDNRSATATATVTIEVNNTPMPPVANAGNKQTITLPVNTVTLDGSRSSSASGGALRYEWLKLSGPAGGIISKAQSVSTVVTGLMVGEYQFSLKVTDSNSLTATSVVTIVVKAAPLPPVANAGNSQTVVLPVNQVTLNGAQSFGVSATIIRYEWGLLSGPAGSSMSNSNNVSAQVFGLKEGSYVFQLTVTDQLGNKASATVTIIVKPQPLTPPVALAGDDIKLRIPLGDVQLDGSQSYANDGASIVGYRWSQLSGPGLLTITDATTAKPTIATSETGTYLVSLTVTDSRGQQSTDDIAVLILPPVEEEPLPVAYAGENVEVVLPEHTVELNGWASSSEYGTIEAYNWKLLRGPSSVVIDNPQADAIQVTNLIEGVYEFELTVTDNNGRTAATTVTVTVSNAGGRPDFSSGAVKIYPNPLQHTGTLEVNITSKGRTIVNVYDVNARLVMRHEFIKDDFTNKQKLDFSKLSKGVFFVEVIVDYQHRYKIKVIKN